MAFGLAVVLAVYIAANIAAPKLGPLSFSPARVSARLPVGLSAYRLYACLPAPSLCSGDEGPESCHSAGSGMRVWTFAHL
jgi:hypothetical protein